MDREAWHVAVSCSRKESDMTATGTELNIQYLYMCLENSQLMLKMKKERKREG